MEPDPDLSVCPVCGLWQPFGHQSFMLVEHVEQCSKLPGRRNKWAYAVDVAYIHGDEVLESAILDGARKSATTLKARGNSRRTVKLDPFVWATLRARPPAFVEDAAELRRLLRQYVDARGTFVYDVSLLRREWLIRLGTKYRCPNGRLINGNRISTTPKSNAADANWREALRMDQTKKGFEVDADTRDLLLQLKAAACRSKPALDRCVVCNCELGVSIADLRHVYGHFKDMLLAPDSHGRWLVPVEHVTRGHRFVGQAFQYPATVFFRNPLDSQSDVLFRDLDYLGYLLALLYQTQTPGGVELAAKDRLYLPFVDDAVRDFLAKNYKEASALVRHEPQLFTELWPKEPQPPPPGPSAPPSPVRQDMFFHDDDTDAEDDYGLPPMQHQPPAPLAATSAVQAQAQTSHTLGPRQPLYAAELSARPEYQSNHSQTQAPAHAQPALQAYAPQAPHPQQRASTTPMAQVWRLHEHAAPGPAALEGGEDKDTLLVQEIVMDTLVGARTRLTDHTFRLLLQLLTGAVGPAEVLAGVEAYEPRHNHYTDWVTRQLHSVQQLQAQAELQCQARPHTPQPPSDPPGPWADREPSEDSFSLPPYAKRPRYELDTADTPQDGVQAAAAWPAYHAQQAGGHGHYRGHVAAGYHDWHYTREPILARGEADGHLFMYSPYDQVHAA